MPNNPLIIRSTIKHLQPVYKKHPGKADLLAKAIYEESKKANIDWRIVVALFYQESSLLSDPQQCIKPGKACQDYGIGQINYKVWSKKLNIDKNKILTDVPYAVQTSIKVLKNYEKKYSKRELNWYTRYHSGTPSFRNKYMDALNKGFEKINKYLDAYKDAYTDLNSRNM